MGLSKQYLRYLPLSQFGVIASTRCNIVFLFLRNSTTRYVATGSCEHVNIWDVKTGHRVMVLEGEKHFATFLAKSPNGKDLAVGYGDGTIKVFSLMTSEVLVTYSGHLSAVSCMSFDHNGMRLASGSNDGEVIVWDLVNESGLYKLKSHKDQVTACSFLKKKNMLVTSSKDTFVKWWELDTQHCFKTMVGHRAEVWDFVITPNEDTLITGSSDSSLRIWKIEYNDENDAAPVEKRSKLDEEHAEENRASAFNYGVICKSVGSCLRDESDRVVSLRLSTDGRLLVCHGTARNMELFKIRSEDEIRTYLKKKAKKLKRNADSETQEDVSNDALKEEAADFIASVGKYKTSGKIKSLDVSKSEDGYQISSLLHNNQVILLEMGAKLHQSELTPVAKVFSAGHRGFCRSACFTSDSMALLTTSTNSIKMWNRVSQQCIRTFETDHATSCTFVHGDKQFLVGTISGTVEIHDVSSGKCLEKVDAHSNSVTDVAIFPNKQGFATSSKDNAVKFWNFDLILDEEFSPSTKRLTATHARTLQLDEEVSVVRFSNNGKLIACALLNCSVKIFYVDSLKFFLSLYGHSLPVTCMSITSDDTLIATGSSDRNIKIWGLDFGDCHKSIFAHDDNITAVQFLPDTHLLFSAGKDGLIKQWDADKFIHIQTLQGHLGAVLCLVSDLQGDFLASCGADISLRLWSRSSEIVIPEEEHEKEREEEDEKSLVKNLGQNAKIEDDTSESAKASKPTIKTIRGAEQIMEAFEIYREEKSKREESNSEYQPHPILIAYGNISPERYVLEILRKVKSADLEESLLVLPFSYIPELLKLLNEFVSKGWEVELSCRCLFYLLRIHQGVITSSNLLIPVLANLQKNTAEQVQKLQDVIGFNMAALNHCKREMESKQGMTFFEDATDKFSKRTKKQKKKLQHAVITM